MRDRVGPHPTQQAPDHGCVGVSDLVTFHRVTGRPHLVAGGQHDHAWPAGHGDLGVPHGGGDPHVLRLDHGPRGHKGVTLSGIRPARMHRVPRIERCELEPHGVAAVALLEGHDRVDVVR